MKYKAFAPEDWARIRRDWTAWWNGTLERPLVLLWTRESDHPPGGVHDNLVRWPVGTPPETILDHYEVHFETTHYHGDAFPQWWPNAGPGIMAAFLGARPVYAAEGDVKGTTWFEPLQVESISDLKIMFDPENAWWQHCQAVMQAAVARWGDRVVFGHTDLGGNMDILASLRGTQALLFDCYDAPEQIDRLTSEITTLWLGYYDALQALIASSALSGTSYWARFWSPGTGYMLQSDFCYMISPQMFERFVLPDLLVCCDHLEYPFYHLDGKGELPHLDMLLEIPNLRGIQWQPGDGQPTADGWLDVLRRIREAGKLCQVYVTLDGAKKIVRELGGKGFQFQLVLETFIPEEADDVVAGLRD
ncbi:MAG: LD-carboxypeptidase [Chloroflexi bacterium]|nr:LD-carboxypeptidase [Chloroflexota bacterium]